jgi:putative transposase
LGKVRFMSRERRREMATRKHPALSTVRQCVLLGISRSGLYYRPRVLSQQDLALMKEMDQQYPATPFYGSLDS